MKKKILVIEDDKDTLEILAYIAENLNISAELSPGVMSLSQVKEINPDLILMDYRTQDGYSDKLCAELKNHPETAHLPVVIISAHPNIADIAVCCKADSFLAKPFDIDEIEGAIQNFIKA